MSDSPPGVGHTDSIESHDTSDKQPEKKKSRRPANTAFRQQRLKAWQPILTPKTVLPLFFTIGIIFAPIGGLLLYASSEVQELRLDYTDCGSSASEAPTFDDMDPDLVTTAFKSGSDNIFARWRRYVDVEVTPDLGLPYTTNICELEFRVPKEMGPPVLFYYHLTNFYQNHRRYVESFYDAQLKGDRVSDSSVRNSKCDPQAWDDDEDKPIYPCGLIANSMFNDTFSSLQRYNEGNDPVEYAMNNSTDIAWASDADLYGETKVDYDRIVPPVNWRRRFPVYNETIPPPKLHEWAAFQVWMRTAGLPEFSKLYQRNDDEPLRAEGTYRVNVTDNFPTKEYKGTKSLVISTRTVMGGRNSFLGIAYVVVGGVCILLGVIFTVTHLLKPRKLGDHTYLSWNNTPGAKAGQVAGSGAAMASGRDLRPGDA